MEAKHPEQTPLAKATGLKPSLLIDVVEKEDRLYVNVELPGVSASEIDVRISEGLLNLCTDRERIDAVICRNKAQHVTDSSDSSRPAVTEQSLPRLQDFRSGVFSMAEKRYLASLVQHVGQNVSKACQLSGLSRSRLYSLLKKHRISLH